MAQKTSDLSKQFWSLTPDLRPVKSNVSNDLRKARVTIASALASNESSILRSSSTLFQTDVELTQVDEKLLDAAISESSPDLLERAAYVVARRQVTVVISGPESLVPNAMAGQTIDLDVITGVGIYDPALTQILYPAKTTSSTFEVIDVRSDQFILANSASIQLVAWAQPVAATSASSLGLAAGAGSLAMFLNSGLAIARKGQSRVIPANPLVVHGRPSVVPIDLSDKLPASGKNSLYQIK